MTMTAEDRATLYAGWPDERLVRAAYLDFKGYAPDAVQMMRSVLEARGVSRADIDEILAQLDSPKAGKSLNGIRGWLLAFVIHVAIVTTGQFISAGLMLLAAEASHHLAAGLIGAVVAGYGVYCSRLLTSRSPRAPAHAQRLMIAWAASSVAIAALWSPADGGPIGAGRPLLFAAIWFPYLRLSRRVRTVYAAP